MAGCSAMRVKSRKGKSRKSASKPLKKISSIVKALAKMYKKQGKKIDIGKLGKEAGRIYRGEKSLPKSAKLSRGKKS